MFNCGRYSFDLAHPLVMGIVNVTPDSFSDGGRHDAPADAIAHGLRMREEGAHILDIGGESARPGASPVSVQEELDRVMPVLEGLRDCGAALSVDTMKAEVMRAALAAGADMINDVNAFLSPGALEAVVCGEGGLCVMHMQGQPRSMQAAPEYQDVVAEVRDFLARRLAALAAAGVDRNRVLVDPGFGFGKTLDHNLALFKSLAVFTDMAPVLVGVSRKSMLGELTGRDVAGRLPASVAAAVLAVQKGARVVRVHDVAETVDALKILQALGEGQ